MEGNFCKRTARRIRQLGYTAKRAIWYAGFFFLSMLSVCGLAGTLIVPTTEVNKWITAYGKILLDTRICVISPGFFSAHRN
jgi:putative copper export protein